MWSLEGADMALETAHMNQEISWGPVLCGLSRVPAKHFSNTSHFDLKRSSPLLPVLPQDVTGNTSTWQWRRDFVCMYYSAVPLSFQTKHLRAILTRRSAEFLRTFSSSEVNGCGFCGRQVCYTHTRHPALNTSVSLKARKRRWMLWGQSRAFHHMFLCSQVQQKRRRL